MKANVSRAGGGGSAGTAPLAQQLSPQAQSTQLMAGQINNLGNQAIRAFVIETDVTDNQERIRRLNRAARL